MEVVLDGQKTMNNSASTDKNKNKSCHVVEPASKKRRKYFQIKMTPPLYQTVKPVIVPVSFITLPVFIDELWKTFVEIGGEPFRLINTLENKNIFKKVMLTLAEAKVCCAQRAIPVKFDVDLPQREQYLHHELVEFNLLVKQIPYPLAVYLDCLGNTVEGKLNITPVLATGHGATNIAGAISGAPQRLLPLLHLLKNFISDCDQINITRQLKDLPNFQLVNHQNHSQRFTLPQSSLDFWLKPDGKINLSDGDTKIFKEIIACFNDKNFNAKTDLLKGQGRMAQTVQTPKWFVDRPFRYFCMTDISEHDQQLGATFGFSYTSGLKKQESRYDGCYEIAYWHGEVMPQKMLKSMLDENPLFELQEAQEAI